MHMRWECLLQDNIFSPGDGSRLCRFCSAFLSLSELGGALGPRKPPTGDTQGFYFQEKMGTHMGGGSSLFIPGLHTDVMPGSVAAVL